MSAGTSPLFFLIVCFLFCSSDGQINIPADLGQDVILPCKVPNNIKDIAVEWIRPDQDPEYVIFYRDGRLDPDNQHPSYQNRVDLQDKDMKDGDFSLILKNVMMEDTGIYECLVFEKGKIDPVINITLKVHLSVQTTLTADLGQNTTLPCKVPNIINISSVIWSRLDLHPGHVLVYRNGRIDPDNQNPSYQNRVDLQDKEMKNGDVSLVLKNVTMEDSGRYECLVFEKGKNYPIIRITILEVLPSGDKDESTGDGGDNVGIIVGSVVGVILLLAVLASVGFLIYRRLMKKNPNLSVPPVEPPAREMLPVPESRAEPPTASVPLMEPTAEESPEM